MDFEGLYQMYFKDIYYYILGIAKDPTLSEEVTQETFYKAIRSIDRFDGKKDIKAWLFTIARNTYLSHMRKKSSRVEERLPQDITEDINFIDQLIDRERSLLIHRFIHKMSEPYKEVFNLRVFGELSFDNIGSIFGKSPGWARVTYHRARKQIIEYMEEIENEDN